jgi:hypothetical protein
MGAAGGAAGAGGGLNVARQLRVEALDVGARVTLRGRRRVYAAAPPRPLDALPADWRALAAQWIERAPRARWKTLLADAGHARVELAQALKDWLLEGGWVAVEETRAGTRWEPLWIEFRQPAAMRAALGLADPEGLRDEWQQRRARIAHGALSAHLAALDALTPGRALERADLLQAVDRWRSEKRHGTRRDFAQFARGSTKSVSAAEWQWLQQQLDLAAVGIERHAPTLLLRAPLALATVAGEIDLRAAPDFVGVTAETLRRVQVLRGHLDRWRVIENRTSFERCARAFGDRDAVLWVPGFAPDWWTEVVARLLSLAPAPALIACDPDPSGIEIALAVGRLWHQAGLPWDPWQMSATALAALPQRRPLSAFDSSRLQALLETDLPADLAALARWMAAHGEKGEQEALL